MRRMLVVVLVSGLSVIATGAQTKAPVTRADYGQWESISAAGPRGGFSPNGQWLAYALNRSNRNNELRFLKIADGTTKDAAFGTQPTFSADSKWAAYAIGHSEAEQERMRTERRPIQNKLGLLNLSSGETSTIDGVQSFSFSGDGAFLAMRRYPPTPAGEGRAGGAAAPATPTGTTGSGGAGAAAADDEPTGATVIVRDLTTGKDTSFGNIGEYAWQNDERAHLLALTISAEGKTGNGVHLFDPKTTIFRVLDSSAANYIGLSWREKSADLAVLRAQPDDKKTGSTHVALAWRQLGDSAEKRVEFDPTAAAGVPAGMRTVSFRRPSWSEDGKVIFVGLAKWEDKPPTPSRGRGAGSSQANTTAEGATPPAGGAEGSTTPQRPAGGSGAAAEADEAAAVDIWHWNDVDVMAKQKLTATADRRRNYLSAWHLDTNRFVQVGKSFTEQVAPTTRPNVAFVEEWATYAMDRSIGRPAADLFVVDLTTGARTKIKDRVDDRYAQVSPTGRYVLFLEDDHYWTIDLSSRTVRNLTKSVATSFIDRESDATIKQKPAFGLAGWTKDDAALVLYDKFDLWQVAADGSRATRLTDGAGEPVRHRYVRVNPDEKWIDLDSPIYVSLFGLWSKKSGYGRLMPDNGVERLVFLDKSVTGLGRAKDAPVFTYIAQAYDDSPDIFVAGPDLKNGKQVTTTNAFQSKYAWGRSEVIEYKTDKGRRLQGALYYPAGYEAGKPYPMVVYLYERLSDGVHRYVPPSDRDYYNTSVFTTQGYFVFQPDIVFRPREPGLSVVECVTPGVKRVVQMGVVDAKRVGVVGHSWGGFDTAFLATHTDVFSAAVAGAAITNLVSNYGNHHWSSGIAETDHIETGQQRMEVPLWEDFQAYVRNSAVFNVQNMTTPLMLMTGDNDGTVFWHQAVELYNIARRARKNVVMLVYNGEDHGLRQKKNQTDYQRRILEWFGHYLKGDPAPVWITTGSAYIERR
jgi:dipeptidyl aminopeptidase/acylaminoacyl peptidase